MSPLNVNGSHIYYTRMSNGASVSYCTGSDNVDHCT